MADDLELKPFRSWAEKVSDTIQPTAVDPDTPYIGLEHIGEDTLSLIGHSYAKHATSAKTRFKPGDILFGKLRPYFRKVCRPLFDGICSTDIWVIRASQGVDQGFLFYRMASQEFIDKTMEGSKGTHMPRADWEHIESWLLPLPKPPVQRKIAYILSSLDKKIELNRQIARTLDEMAQAIFKSWFIDFDPVHAKAEGRSTGLPVDIDAMFPSSFEDSVLGDIPSGWSATPLSEVLTESNERIGELEAPEYSSTNHGLTPRSARFKKQLSVSSAKNKLVREGYLVFGMSRQVLNFGLMRDGLGSVSSAYRVYKIDTNAVEADLVERVMRIRSDYFYNIVSSSSREGQSIAPDALKRLYFVKPSIAAQREYYRFTAEMRERSMNALSEVDTLATLRDALLPKLISGQVNVSDVAVLD